MRGEAKSSSLRTRVDRQRREAWYRHCALTSESVPLAEPATTVGLPIGTQITRGAAFSGLDPKSVDLLSAELRPNCESKAIKLHLLKREGDQRDGIRIPLHSDPTRQLSRNNQLLVRSTPTSQLKPRSSPLPRVPRTASAILWFSARYCSMRKSKASARAGSGTNDLSACGRGANRLRWLRGNGHPGQPGRA